MDWMPIIDRNRAALLQVLAMLVRLVGIASGGAGGTVQRHVRLNVLRVLRPAEAAARRLVVILAKGLAVPSARPAPAVSGAARKDRKGVRPACFPLFDPRFRDGVPKIRSAAGPGPRIRVIGSDDPWAGDYAGTPPVLSDDPVDAGTLQRRIGALHAALDDLPKQARRLARIMERRRRAPPGPLRLGPLRPGRPPGHRMRAGGVVNAILERCHDHARYALSVPDTS